MKIFRLKLKDGSGTEEFSIEELFELLNKDRSNDWENYDINTSLQEIIEGIELFTEYTTK